jgi:hypothetical protein
MSLHTDLPSGNTLLAHSRRHNPHHGACPTAAQRGLNFTSPKKWRPSPTVRENA